MDQSMRHFRAGQAWMPFVVMHFVAIPQLDEEMSTVGFSLSNGKTELWSVSMFVWTVIWVLVASTCRQLETTLEMVLYY